MRITILNDGRPFCNKCLSQRAPTERLVPIPSPQSKERMGLSYDEAGVRKGVDLNIACDAHFTGSDARPASRSWLPKLAIGEEARTIPCYVVNHPVNLTDPLGPIAFYWHRSRSGRVGPSKAAAGYISQWKALSADFARSASGEVNALRVEPERTVSGTLLRNHF
jgi:hypothetical protein